MWRSELIPRLRRAPATGVSSSSEPTSRTQVDAFVACASLHHVTDPGAVLDVIAETLVPGGVVIVVEWDWERFDEATAQWCFERLGPPDRHDWLQRHRSQWIESGQPWDRYLRTWATEHGIHTGQAMLRELDRRLQRQICRRGPYFFGDLAETSEQDELACDRRRSDSGEPRRLRRQRDLTRARRARRALVSAMASASVGSGRRPSATARPLHDVV